MEQMETAQRLTGCSFGVSGVPFWGKLKAFMEQMETVQRLTGCSFGVSGVPLRGKLKAPKGFPTRSLLRWHPAVVRDPVDRCQGAAAPDCASKQATPFHVAVICPMVWRSFQNIGDHPCA